jgi:23S rRNA (cytosine1962-C5)-methyltransferase
MMQLRYQDFDDFLVVNKGFGFRTHRVSNGQFGLVEFLSEKLGQNLFVVHRLDKDTSGLMIFAKNKETAQKLGELFEKHQVQKTYLLLTDRAHAKASFEVRGFIEKIDNKFVLKSEGESNSQTRFEFVKKIGEHFLWRAHPLTGKPHQIRLHAESAGIPILGDREHGGSDFFRMALHSETLKFAEFSLESEIPSLFRELSGNNYETLLQACLEKRTELYEIPAHESFRLVHAESSRIRADIFDRHLWIYDYSDKGLNEEEKKSSRKFAEANNYQLIIRHMLDRGAGVGGLEKKTLDSQSENSWIADEESVHYVLKTDSGFSPGLFLDQRENRRWVRNQGHGKKVLNLFSYTSGFSVVAALGRAEKVTTVDVSAKFLNWSRENFAANELDAQKHEFFAQDCMLFLKGSVKRNRQWDLIVCDPPTFGRSKDSVWKIEKDLPELASLMLNCLAPKGKILFTCNYEKMNRDEVVKLYTQKIRGGFKIERPPQLSLDYEHTDDLQNLMKGLILTKN